MTNRPFPFYSAPVGTHGNALLNWVSDPVGELVSYACSYKNAAQSLIYIQERRELLTVDHGACPIVFLYRHALELYLKAAICRAATTYISPAEMQNVLPRLWREHSLRKLLDMAQPIFSALEPLLPSALRALRQDVLDLVGELDTIDPGSYSFRYPVTREGKPTLPKMFFLNVFVLAEHADAALNHLNTMCIHLMREQLRISEALKTALAPITQEGCEPG